MRPVVKDKLISALESGEYPQIKGSLRTDNGFCTNGVLTDLYRLETGRGEWVRREGGDWYFRDPDALLGFRVCDAALSSNVTEWAEIDEIDEARILVWNDGSRWPTEKQEFPCLLFPEIAIKIKEEL